MKTFGSICRKRSTTDCAPKSGEQLDHTAPIELTARNAMVASGIHGRYAATRSPDSTPCCFKYDANAATSCLNCFHEISCGSDVSDPQMMAGYFSVSFLKTCSAKFNLMPLNH